MVLFIFITKHFSFGLSYNTNKSTQTQLEMCTPNYPKQLQTGCIRQYVRKTPFAYTTLYTIACSTYSCLTCSWVLLNARGRSFLSSSSSSSSSPSLSSPELQSFFIFFVNLFLCIYLFSLYKDLLLHVITTIKSY